MWFIRHSSSSCKSQHQEKLNSSDIWLYCICSFMPDTFFFFSLFLSRHFTLKQTRASGAEVVKLHVFVFKLLSQYVSGESTHNAVKS